MSGLPRLEWVLIVEIPQQFIHRALVAAVVAVLARGYAVKASADRAARTRGPQPRFEVDAGALVVGEQLEQLERADGGVVVMHWLPLPGRGEPCRARILWKSGAADLLARAIPL